MNGVAVRRPRLTVGLGQEVEHRAAVAIDECLRRGAPRLIRCAMRRPPHAPIDWRDSFERRARRRIDCPGGCRRPAGVRGRAGCRRGGILIRERRRITRSRECGGQLWQCLVAHRVLLAEAAGVRGDRRAPRLTFLVTQRRQPLLRIGRRAGHRFARGVLFLRLVSAQDVEEVMQVQPGFFGLEPEDRRRRCVPGSLASRWWSRRRSRYAAARPRTPASIPCIRRGTTRTAVRVASS